MLRERLPAPSDDTVVLVCGPAGFEASVQRDLSTIGHVHTVNLSSGDVRSPAVSQVLLTAHRLLTPWASALRCFVPHMDSGRSSDSGKAGLGEVRDLTVKELATPVAASRKPLLQEGTEFQQTELLLLTRDLLHGDEHGDEMKDELTPPVLMLLKRGAKPTLWRGARIVLLARIGGRP